MDEFLTENSIIFQKAVQKDAKKVITFLYNLGLTVPDCMFYKQRKLQKNIYNFLNELTCNDIKYLQKKYKKIFYLQDSYQNTLLHYAVLDNNIEFVDCLLSNDFENVNQKNLWFLTPLHEAVRMEFHDMANLLRNYGAFLQTFRDSDQSVIGKRQEYFFGIPSGSEMSLNEFITSNLSRDNINLINDNYKRKGMAFKF
jgi:ankyrin repeat protein